MTEKDDENLLRKLEETLTQIDREQGLSDEHLEVLTALRIRLFGAPKKTLDDVLKAAGDIKGKRSLEDVEPPKKEGSLDDVLKQSPKKKDWPG